jgi:hypothetical protein
MALAAAHELGNLPQTATGDVVELFVDPADAEAFVAERLADEPDCADVLEVVEVEPRGGGAELRGVDLRRRPVGAGLLRRWRSR